MHYDLTEYLATNAGFSANDAKVIAFGNQFTDENPETSPINPYNFGNIRRDSALVALAGPASNMLIAAIVILILRILPYNLSQESLLGSIGIIFAEINIILAVFNLIPLGPLDGFKIVSGLLPTELAQKWEESNQLSYIALIILLFLPIQGQTLVSMLINKISSFIWMLIF